MTRRKKVVKQAVGCLMALTMVMTNSYMGINVCGRAETVAYAEEYIVENSTYSYKVMDDGTIQIIGYDGTDTDIVIPAEIDGKSVTSIGNRAFEECSSLTSIEIPNSITSIGMYAFYGCSSLKSIEIPDGATSTGYGAFERCSSLTSIEIPNSVTSIDGYAFYGCSSLTSIDIPKSVTSIGDFAFCRCYGLEKIEVETGNEKYKSQEGILFNIDMSELIQYPAGKKNEFYTIPNSVTSIDVCAFYGCSSLKSIEIPNGVTSIQVRTFGECSGLKSIEIPNSVTSIEPYAFEGCSSLKNIEIPNSVTNIDMWAFSGCSGLTSVKIPNSVTSIKDYTFEKCSSLKSIEIPDSVIYIGQDAFTGWSGLAILGEKESYAEQYADEERIPFIPLLELLDDTTKIEIRYVEDNIGTNVFIKAKKLTSSDEEYQNIVLKDKIVDSTVKPEDVMFSAYDISIVDENNNSVQPTGIVTVKIPCPAEINGEKCKVYRVKESGDYTDMNAKYEDGYMVFKTDNFYTYIITDTELFSKKNVIAGLTYSYRVLNDGTVQITSYDGMDTDIVIPTQINGKSVTSIGGSAFKDCSSLTRVEIPNSVTSIEDYTFDECSSLTSIEIPDSVTYIGQEAFTGCNGLVILGTKGSYAEQYANDNNIFFNKKIVFDETTEIKVVLPNDISTDVFLKVEQLTESTEGRNIILEDNMADSRIYDISLIDANGDVVSLDEEVTIMIPSPDWNIDNVLYWEYFGKTDENEWDGYKSIETENENGYEIFNTNEWGIYAFRLFTEENPDFTYMYKVLDGGSVEIVHYNNLGDSTELIIPKKIKDKEVTSIGKKAFYGCICSKIVLPDSVTSIGEYAFSDCNSLTNIEIPGSVTSIGKEAFAYCYNLTDIEIPDSVTDIGEGAFRYCESLENLILPDKITSIGDETFAFCQTLTSIKIPNSVKSIGEYAFWGCNKLTIYGEKGSYAEEYANENEIPFSNLSIVISDDTTKIQIRCSEGNISKNVSLKTKKLTSSDEEYKNIILTDKIADSTIKPENVKFSAYEISLIDENNNIVQPTEELIVKIPCPADYNGENCKVYRVGESGEFTDLNAEYKNGYMVFETDHFSTYIITETELKTLSDVILGDANGDGTMDIKDSAIIKRYLAGWDVEINMTAADMDADGKVTIKDGALIKRQLAGWE